MMGKETEKEMKIFAENIAYLRRFYKLSQQEMAKKLRVSTYCISRIENGEVPENLSVNTMIAVYNEFGIMPSKMFEPLNLEIKNP